MTKRTKELCAVCGKAGVLRRRRTRTFGKGPTLLVVENVPVVACPNCGESYITAEKKRSVATVSFA